MSSFNREERGVIQSRRTQPVVRARVLHPPNMRKLVLASSVLVLSFAMLFIAGKSFAAGSAVALESPRIDQGNKRSLQRGAQAFVNNCMGCHTANYQRYSRLAQDLGLSEEDVAANLIFTTDEAGEPTKVGALMANNMSIDYGKQSFGVMPPNLALTARSRGVDWIYSFLRAYYVDPSRTGTGVNNLVYPGTAMPHILWEQQGWQTPIFGEEEHGAVPITGLELTEPGTMSPEEYDDMIADITNFLAYMSDPIKQTRHRIGIFVMLFLFGLLAIAYILKKEYWKDVV